MSETKFSKYNDGVVFLYKEKSKYSSFSAKENATAVDDLELFARLDFEQASRRQQDVEFAEQRGFSLSLKVKTRYIKGVNNKLKAVVDNHLYEVSYVDDDRKDMWLYLQEVRELDS